MSLLEHAITLKAASIGAEFMRRVQAAGGCLRWEPAPRPTRKTHAEA